MALVIFIVLAFIAIGASIWFYQQLSTVSQAVKQNQDEFRTTVANRFRENGWELTTKPAAEFSLEYQREAYDQVVRQLEKAATYEELLPLLGWESVQGVQSKLTRQGSPIQSVMPEPYITLNGLIGEYEGRYIRLTARVAELEKQRDEAKKLNTEQLAAARQREQEDLDKYNAAIRRHRDAMDESGKQFKNMNAMYDQARDETKEWQQEFAGAKQEWQGRETELREEIDTWKELYDATRPGALKAETMEPAGKLLEIDTRYQFVMLEGGKDIDQEKNTSVVVYSESHMGQRARKGELLINDVKEKTSLATIVKREKDEQLLVGDLYVTGEVWEKFYPAARETVAVAPRTPVTPVPIVEEEELEDEEVEEVEEVEDEGEVLIFDEGEEEDFDFDFDFD